MPNNAAHRQRAISERQTVKSLDVLLKPRLEFASGDKRF
jgi:hypothetical protein